MELLRPNFREYKNLTQKPKLFTASGSRISDFSKCSESRAGPERTGR